MSKLLFSLVFICAVARAAETTPRCDTVKWTSDEGVFNVCYLDSQKSFLSEDCAKQKCAAITFLDKTKTYAPVTESHRGWIMEVGSSLCKDLGGKVVIAKNARKSETAFCMAADKSVVALSSLSAVNAKVRNGKN